MRHDRRGTQPRSLTFGGVRREDGQVLTEYVTVVGIMALTVIACMALVISPVAMAFVQLFRRMALYLTSTGS